jgi:2-oxoglutarate ferredoxin oxidoreductase subunit alpha
VRALPLTDEVTDFVDAHEQVFVVEMNTDAQLRQLVQLHVPAHDMRVLAANKSDGLPLTARWITEHIQAALRSIEEA